MSPSLTFSLSYSVCKVYARNGASGSNCPEFWAVKHHRAQCVDPKRKCLAALAFLHNSCAWQSVALAILLDADKLASFGINIFLIIFSLSRRLPLINQEAGNCWGPCICAAGAPVVRIVARCRRPGGSCSCFPPSPLLAAPCPPAPAPAGQGSSVAR